MTYKGLCILQVGQIRTQMLVKLLLSLYYVIIVYLFEINMVLHGIDFQMATQLQKIIPVAFKTYKRTPRSFKSADFIIFRTNPDS